MTNKSEKTRIFRIRFFGAWALHKEEEWLNRMAYKGWLMTDLKCFVYKFRRVQPGTNWIYQLDYNSLSGEELEDYKQLFTDAGWQYVTNFSSWHYFCANADEVAAKKIHTDNESRIAMLWRVTRLLLIAAFPSYIWMMTIGRRVQEQVEPNSFTLMDATVILVIFLMVIIAYSVLRMVLEILRLKREGKE